MSGKIKCWIVFIIIFVSGNPLKAQDSDKFPPKWELGMDLYSLFKPSDTDGIRSTYGLILRRRLKNEYALRLRTGFGYAYDVKPLVKGTNQPRSYDLSFDFGYEKQKRYRKFVHNYGAELAVRYLKTNSTIGVGVTNNASSFVTQAGKQQGYGFVLFTGGKYFITERISVAMESSLNLIYGKTVNTTQQVDINNNPLEEKYINFSSNGLSINIKPISVIYLSYYF